MPDKANSAVPDAGTLDGSEIVYVVKGGNSRRSTTQKIATFGMVASRAELQAQLILVGASRYLIATGMWYKFSNANLSAFVAVERVGHEAIYIPPASDLTGASGAWVCQWNSNYGLDVRWFDAVLDDITDDHLPILTARNMSSALALNPGSNIYYKVGPPVFVPGTAYIASNSYDMHHVHELRGINPTGLNGANYPSHLRANDCDVVIVQAYNTEGTNIVDGTPLPTASAASSLIRKIQLIGNVTTTEGEFHCARV